MATILEVQRALLARGFDVGKAGADGLVGPATLYAVMQSLANDPVIGGALPAPTPKPIQTVPADWMPWCHMLRIVVHWSAGANKASGLDREHYHIVIEGDGTLVRGNKSIADNVKTTDGVYAAHTLGLNSQSIGVSLAAMAGAEQSPFKAGSAPITKTQWLMLPSVLADLCRRYSIPVTRQTVLSHAEVQPTLGIKQKGKWDIAWVPGMVKSGDPIIIGDQFRAEARALLG